MVRRSFGGEEILASERRSIQPRVPFQALKVVDQSSGEMQAVRVNSKLFVNCGREYVLGMQCESCHQRAAVVHLNSTTQTEGEERSAQREQHFCEECADAYFACTPGMNSSRNLICLSDSYRTRLYDLLERIHPEAFDTRTEEACEKGSDLMRAFLRDQFSKEKVEMNEDAFDMLCADFYCSHHFYSRADEYNRKKGSL